MKDPEESRAEDKDAFFVGYREVRSNDKKTTKVYLTRAGVTAGTGTARSETLAAVGENTSSAVVRFRNASNFNEHGSCRTDSKKELYTWLDGIVAEGIARSEGMDTKGAKETGGIDGSMTQGQGQGQGQGNPHPPNPSNAPSLYANHSSEKFVFPDGRRGIRFFLIDAEGNAQCAVVGEERDTRDGHYVYRKEAGFAFGPPLVVGNLIGVNRWLRDACVAGGAGSGSISFGSHPPKKGGFGASARGQNNTNGLNNQNAPGGADPLLWVDLKRKRDSKYFASDHTGDDRDDPTSVLNVCVRDTRWEASRCASLAWVRETVDTDTKKTVDAITEVFEQARVFEDGNPGVSKKERKKRKTESTTEIVAALRLLSSTYVSLQLLSTTSLKEELDHLLTHDNPAVRAMAQTLKTAWLADLRARVGTLSATYERPALKTPTSAQNKTGTAKPPRAPKLFYTNADIASRRNEPELRRTRETRDDAERRETAERDVRVRLAKELRDANAAAAKAKKEAAALGGVLIGGPPREGAVPVATASTVNSSLAMPGGPGISASPQKALNLNAPVSPTAVHKPGPATGGSTEASGFPGPVAGVGGDGQGIGTTGAVTAPGIDTTGQSNGMDMNGIGTTGAVNEKSGKKHHGPKSGENPGGGTPLGKGRKLCARCSQIVGSPTRVCPHCQHTLPMKEAKSPKGEGKGGGVSGGGGGASGAGPPVPTGAGANGYGQLVIPGQLLSGPGPTGDSENPVQSSVAHFLSRHVAKFTNCKVSQLKRNVLELGGGIGAILDAGRVPDDQAAKNLQDAMKKMQEVKLLQGVVERPRARREVIQHLENAIKMCQQHGV